LMNGSLDHPSPERPPSVAAPGPVRPPALANPLPRSRSHGPARRIAAVTTAAFRAVLVWVCSKPALRNGPGLRQAGPDQQFLKAASTGARSAVSGLCGRLQWMRPALSKLLIHPAAYPLTDPGRSARGRAAWTFRREAVLAGAVRPGSCSTNSAWRSALGYLPADDVLSTLEQRPAQLM